MNSRALFLEEGQNVFIAAQCFPGPLKVARAVGERCLMHRKERLHFVFPRTNRFLIVLCPTSKPVVDGVFQGREFYRNIPASNRFVYEIEAEIRLRLNACLCLSDSFTKRIRASQQRFGEPFSHPDKWDVGEHDARLSRIERRSVLCKQFIQGGRRIKEVAIAFKRLRHQDVGEGILSSSVERHGVAGKKAHALPTAGDGNMESGCAVRTNLPDFTNDHIRSAGIVFGRADVGKRGSFSISDDRDAVYIELNSPDQIEVTAELMKLPVHRVQQIPDGSISPVTGGYEANLGRSEALLVDQRPGSFRDNLRRHAGHSKKNGYFHGPAILSRGRRARAERSVSAPVVRPYFVPYRLYRKELLKPRRAIPRLTADGSEASRRDRLHVPSEPHCSF